jgi:hypothetical protein
VESLLAVLERIAEALERLEENGIVVLADAENIEETMREVKGN